MRTGNFARLGAACVALLMLDANDNAPQRSGMLPDRLLTCTLGHLTNFDPHREQTQAELRFDGYHSFILFLPSIPVLAGRPHDASEPALPVDPRTRIVSDPDHISGQPDKSFGRIVDLWPDRTELSATISGPLLNTIDITPIDQVHGVATMLMMRATELTHFDSTHMYQGTCRISAGQET